MARRRRRRRRGEFFLSEPIIHRIQSFLDGREAARTTVLSKSWRQAWLTRPNLDFDGDHFSNFVEVSKLMDKTIRRYEESNLKIESFSLIMESLNCFREDLIIKALGMGVTRLSLKLHESSSSAYYCYVLSAEVYGCKDLVELSLSGGRLALDPEDQVQLLRLKALSLSYITVGSDEVISGLLSGCPLLKKLELRHLRINTSFLGDLSCKCPLLRDLSIHHCSFQGNLLISSPTIEYLNIEYLHIERSSTAKTVREWESHLSITSSCCVGTAGFIGLNKLLTDLIHSKIHLVIKVDLIKVGNTRNFNNDVWEFNGLTLHQVEELMIDGMDYNISSFMGFSLGFALFDFLFRLCRPKFITQHNPKASNPIPCVSDFLFTLFLRHGINHECSARSLDMYGLRHLEEVRAQTFYADVYTWRLITLDTWDALKDKKKIRFQLKWRDESQHVN